MCFWRCLVLLIYVDCFFLLFVLFLFCFFFGGGGFVYNSFFGWCILLSVCLLFYFQGAIGPIGCFLFIYIYIFKCILTIFVWCLLIAVVFYCWFGGCRFLLLMVCCSFAVWCWIFHNMLVLKSFLHSLSVWFMFFQMAKEATSYSCFWIRFFWEKTSEVPVSAVITIGLVCRSTKAGSEEAETHGHQCQTTFLSTQAGPAKKNYPGTLWRWVCLKYCNIRIWRSIYPRVQLVAS